VALVAASVNGGRRPITEAERPHLAALGEHVRALRTEAGIHQHQAAALASLTAGHVSAIERGRRRTRRSTLARIVAALVPDEDRHEIVLDELVEVAGPALAAESDYLERVARRRARRDRSAVKETRTIMRTTIAMLRREVDRGGPHVEKRRRILAGLEADLASFTANHPETPEPAPSPRARPVEPGSLRLPGRGGRAATISALDQWLAERRAVEGGAE